CESDLLAEPGGWAGPHQHVNRQLLCGGIAWVDAQPSLAGDGGCLAGNPVLGGVCASEARSVGRGCVDIGCSVWRHTLARGLVVAKWNAAGSRAGRTGRYVVVAAQ